MKWIQADKHPDIPINKTIIVEDCNGWIGQAFRSEESWELETFGQTQRIILFDTIVRYIILDD